MCKGWTRATEEQIANFDLNLSKFWDFDKWFVPEEQNLERISNVTEIKCQDKGEL